MAAKSSSVLKIVLIVFGALLGLSVILAMIAVPQLIKLKISTNETSAIQSIREIEQAEITYNSQFPTQGFACSLSTLSTPPASLIEGDLSHGRKAGYAFNITNCKKVTLNNQDQYTSFVITAVPESPGKTGSRGFCAGEDNTIKYDPEGGTNCTQPIE